MSDGTVSEGSLELVGVTEDSVGLDTVEKLGSEGNTTRGAGGEGPGIDGEEGDDTVGNHDREGDPENPASRACRHVADWPGCPAGVFREWREDSPTDEHALL